MFAILLAGWGLTEYLGIIHKDQLREESQGKLDLLAASLSGETAPADGVVRLFAGSPTSAGVHVEHAGDQPLWTFR